MDIHDQMVRSRGAFTQTVKGLKNALASRLRIWAAAFSVKVMARMRAGSTPASTRRRKYSTSTVVFPEPGPATTQASTWRRLTSMASRCAGV